jgi:SAM-dependent methyltransferase
MAGHEAEFSAVQRAYFDYADRERFVWTTAGAGFAEVEDEVLAPFVDAIVGPCLEVGCGEGTNLMRLRRRGWCVGIDLFRAKLVFAAQQLPDAAFATADAAALPFRDASFRSVFMRDLLHHVPAPERVLAEAVRVLAPGGALCVLEPNGRNPIVLLQTLLVAAERGARRSGPAPISALLSGLPLTAVDVRMLQPLPLRRLVLHYKLGLPSLGRHAAARRALVALERALGRLLPASRWTYVAATARRI